MDENRLMFLLGISRKANRIVFGKDQLRSYLKQPRRNKMLFLACDASDTTKKNWKIRCKSQGAKCIILKEHNRITLGKAIGKDNISAVAVDDEGLLLEISKIITQAGGE